MRHEGPFGVIPSRIFDIVEFPADVAILAALCVHANREGQCWPSQARLAEMTRLSRPYVNARLAWLEEKGIIQSRERVEKGTKSKVYTLLFLGAWVTGDAAAREPSLFGEEPGVIQDDKRGVNSVDNPVNSPDTNNTKNKKETLSWPETLSKTAPDERAIKIAADHAFTDLPAVTRIWTDFALWHQAKGSRFRDWYGAWVLWLRRRQAYGQRSDTGSGGVQGARDTIREAYEKHRGSKGPSTGRDE